MTPKTRERLELAFSIVLLVGATWALNEFLGKYHYSDILAYIGQLSWWKIFRATALVGLAYYALTFYDFYAIHIVGGAIPYRKLVFASFVSYVFSHNLGLGGLPGHSVRYKFYKKWGMRTAQIAKVIALTSITFWLGVCLLGGVIFSSGRYKIPENVALPVQSVQLLGVMLLGVVVSYVVACVWWRKPLKFKKLEVSFPPLRLAICQLLIPLFDWGFAAAVLYSLLPSEPHLSFFTYFGAHLVAQILANISYVPGGIGVFEFVIVALLTLYYKEADILGALLMFRVLYFGLPLALSLVGLTGYEGRQWMKKH